MNMEKHVIRISPLTPLISRDSRPFGQGQGNRVRSLDWLTPGVVAGSLRTMVGKLASDESEPTFDVEKLKNTSIRGPLPAIGEILYFPRPLDIVARQEGHKITAVYAQSPSALGKGEGMNWPDVCRALQPAMLRPLDGKDATEDDFKPAKLPAFWSLEKMTFWLGNYGLKPEMFERKKPENSLDFLDALEKDERTHIRIQETLGTAEDEMLFSTTGLDFHVREKTGDKTTVHPVDIVLDVASPDYDNVLKNLESVHTLGGERRLARWAKVPGLRWEAPERLRNELTGKKRLRMVLATPALFSGGWLPGWLDESLTGTIPGTDVAVKLISAVVDRWRPLSGWSYETGKGGEKPMRRMVPAGSVYFFEICGGAIDGAFVDSVWLRSVCDDGQDARDGYGLALWGVY